MAVIVVTPYEVASELNSRGYFLSEAHAPPAIEHEAPLIHHVPPPGIHTPHVPLPGIHTPPIHVAPHVTVPIVHHGVYEPPPGVHTPLIHVAPHVTVPIVHHGVYEPPPGVHTPLIHVGPPTAGDGGVLPGEPPPLIEHGAPVSRYAKYLRFLPFLLFFAPEDAVIDLRRL